MKKALLFILIVILTQSLFSLEEETKSNNLQKAIDFSFGVGYSQSGMLGIAYYDNNRYNTNSFNNYGYMGYNYISLNIPFNFTYHFNSNFGMGFNYTLEIGNKLSMGFLPNAGFILTNKIKLANKIGTNIKVSSLLIEYGVMILISFNLSYYNYYYDYVDDDNIFIGPTIFIGRELLYKSFSFTLGGNIDILMSSKDFYDKYEIDSELNHIQYTYTFINLGIEFRWRFGFIKNID